MVDYYKVKTGMRLKTTRSWGDNWPIGLEVVVTSVSENPFNNFPLQARRCDLMKTIDVDGEEGIYALDELEEINA